MMYSAKQLAETLGLAVDTVYHWRWRYKNKLTLPVEVAELCGKLIQVGRTVKIDSRDVEEWQASQRGQLRRKKYPGTPRSELIAKAKQLVKNSRDVGAELAARLFELGIRILSAEKNLEV